jgi:hypothetical protein
MHKKCVLTTQFMEPNALGHGSLQRFRKICASRLPQVSTHHQPHHVSVIELHVGHTLCTDEAGQHIALFS